MTLSTSASLTLDRLQYTVQLRAATVELSLLPGIDRAEVAVRGSSDARCDRWQRHRWVCPGGRDWHYVGRLETDVDYNPRRCLWAHPVSQGKLTIGLPA